MSPAGGIILSLAYILGLLSTATAWGKFAVLVLGFGAGAIVPRFWRTGPKLKLWLAAGIVGFLASLYIQARQPHPQENDISKKIPTHGMHSQVVTVQGVVASVPHLTRSERSQFWLEATNLNQGQNSNDTPDSVSQSVSGKLYVTVPLLAVTDIHPGDAIAVTGILYEPKPAANPGAFDFKDYLTKEGAFAGLKGRSVRLAEERSKLRWGWWALRQRIIRSQVNGLSRPEGLLVSSMVLSSKVVDLPYDIKDHFIGVGLAHVLGAPGFKLSLILGVLLTLTRDFSAKTRFSLGLIVLVMVVGLTGMQPSVMRAAFMGFGALVALLMERKRKSRGLLLVAATALLLVNPLWIWDLGFQLSFLATLGLLVTTPPLMKLLDWLPPAIASPIAVSIAATLWTLPVQIYAFRIFIPYSILANIIATPFVIVILMGGLISAVAGLILPLAGSALAWCLYYPTHWLINIVQFFYSLPGNSLAVGRISVLQLIALYGLIVLVWQFQWWHRRWWLAALVAVAMVVLPIVQTNLTLFRVTVLATRSEQVLVIQDHGKILLVNSGDANTVRFTLLPFLQQQGVNEIEWAVALDGWATQNDWRNLLKQLPCKTFYINQATSTGQAQNLEVQTMLPSAFGVLPETTQPLPVGKTVPVGSTTIKLISAEPPVLLAKIRGQNWLLLGELSPDAQKQVARELPQAQVLYWSGASLTTELLDALQPAVAIAQATRLDSETWHNLEKNHTKLYRTGRDGAVQWTPNEQFSLTQETDNNAQQL